MQYVAILHNTHIGCLSWKSVERQCLSPRTSPISLMGSQFRVSWPGLRVSWARKGTAIVSRRRSNFWEPSWWWIRRFFSFAVLWEQIRGNWRDSCGYEDDGGDSVQLLSKNRYSGCMCMWLMRRLYISGTRWIIPYCIQINWVRLVFESINCPSWQFDEPSLHSN